jgi:branched-chain amino acid transport system ATP-binding protein
MSKPLITVDKVTMRFGGIVANKDVSFTVNEGSITALIGPNGAGKTTLFNCVTGFYKASKGRIVLARPEGDVEIGRLLSRPVVGGSYLVARAGIARTFQNIRLFREMTVLENLLIAQHGQVNRNILAGVFNTKSYGASERRAIDHAYVWLRELDLESDANKLAGQLPYGRQRRLEIARAMCTSPRLICLDEPAAGLNPAETVELSALVQRLRRDHGVTVMVIEHDMKLVMDISDHIVVLDHGAVIASGTPTQIVEDPNVIAAYLGVSEEEVAA